MKRSTKKNKRGDVPVTILVLGIFIICVIAIASFYLADGGVKKDFDMVNIIKNAKLMKDRVDFYQNLGYSQEDINNILGLTVDGTGRYYSESQGKISVKYYIP